MKCPNCDFLSEKTNILFTHQQIHRHKINATFKCFDCLILFKSLNVLKQHVLRNHNLQIPKNSSKKLPTSSSLSCKNCFFHHANESALIKHLIKKHIKKGQSVICFHCSNILFSESNLRSHFHRNHNKKQPIPSAPVPLEQDRQLPVPVAPLLSDPNDSENDNVPDSTHEQDNLDFEKVLIFAFLKLKSRYGVTENVLQIFYEELKNLFLLFSSEVLKIIEELSKKFIDLSQAFHPKFYQVQSQFNFDSLSSAYKRIKIFKQQFGFVAPETVNLGKNNDHIDCKYQYVPIKNSLTSLLSEPSFFQKIQQQKTSKPNVLQDYNDGKIYKSERFRESTEWDLTIELILFSDAYGLGNPLAAVSNKYKLNGFYYSIGNFEPIERSKIDNIQLVSLCREKHIKHFGWNEFSKYMVAELKHLETVGFTTQNLRVRVVLVAIAGDNLGSHALGGFTENFSSVESFCRFCYYTKSKLDEKENCLCERRTITNYTSDLANKRAVDSHHNGVKFDSVFNELAHYHVCDSGLPPCLGHDLFHGAFSFDLQLIFKELARQNVLSIQTSNAILQKCVQSFRNFYSFPKINPQNKKLRGSMSEVYKIITVLPYFLLFAPPEAIEKQPDLMNLMMKMVRITQLAVAPSISVDQVCLLTAEIEEYFRLRLQIFPNNQLLPKHHFLCHYPELIREYGPLGKFWTLPFEHKHQYFKIMMGHAKNYINESKLLAERHQFLQVSLKNDRFESKISTNTAQMYDPAMFDFDVDQDVKFYCKSATFNHQHFYKDDYIVFDYNEDENTVKLLQIKCILLTENFDRLLFIGPITKVIGDDETNLYEPITSFSRKFAVVPGDKLLIFKPVNCLMIKKKLYLTLPFTFPIFYSGS
jgi:hypothetical protein